MKTMISRFTCTCLFTPTYPRSFRYLISKWIKVRRMMRRITSFKISSSRGIIRGIICSNNTTNGIFVTLTRNYAISGPYFVFQRMSPSLSGSIYAITFGTSWKRRTGVSVTALVAPSTTPSGSGSRVCSFCGNKWTPGWSAALYRRIALARSVCARRRMARKSNRRSISLKDTKRHNSTTWTAIRVSPCCPTMMACIK